VSANSLKEQFFPKYLSNGKDKFYRFLLFCQLTKLVLMKNNSYKGVSPELEYLEYYEKFIFLYRREGDEVYLEIANLFRKAAHRIYRIMLKQKMLNSYNVKFLNLV
jgi:hypothetical protein